MSRLTVIDLFCGAGGFSEGFRQQDFKIIRGYDYWKPAIDTFNHNFGTNKGTLRNILDYENNIELIEQDIPDSDIIIGSPPCVSFSMSNKSGKVNKSLGIRLIETFLKIVAVKKYKKNSILKGWFMENVCGSLSHIKEYYTFQDLGLLELARDSKSSVRNKAIIIKENSRLLNSAEFGSPQQRIRAIAGEIINCGSLVEPSITHSKDQFLSLGFIKSCLPRPNENPSLSLIQDPLYPSIKVISREISDQFYDTGLYKSIWSYSKQQKVNHPYMGKMSFPENEFKPSRTVTATKIASSREALIYKSEFDRKGNGEYRTPTIREAATLMSFPISYQFIGAESTKWRLVGNAVCPTISRALATTVRKALGLHTIKVPITKKSVGIPDKFNLNTFKENSFDSPPKKNRGSKFRGHPFKEGNITVTLSNYKIKSEEKKIGKWITSIQYGNGSRFLHQEFPDGFFKQLEHTIKQIENGSSFIELINNGFSEKIAKAKILQKIYEEQVSVDGYLEPSNLIDEISNIIERYRFTSPYLEIDQILKGKNTIPKRQLFALYAINRISTKANKQY